MNITPKTLTANLLTLLLATSCFFIGFREAKAQVIPIDTVSLPEYTRTNYIFVQPLYGSFIFNAGHSLMNDKLTNAGAETNSFREMVFFGVAMQRNKWLIGFDVAIPIIHLNSTARWNRNTRIQVTDGTSMMNLEVGYPILNTENIRLLIKGGIGYTERHLIVNRSQANATFDFDRFETLPLESWPNFTHRDAIFNIGVELLPRPRQKTSILYSTKIGYCRGAGAAPWRTGGVRLENPIQDRASIFYLRTAIAIARSR